MDAWDVHIEGGSNLRCTIKEEVVERLGCTDRRYEKLRLSDRKKGLTRRK